MSIIYDPSKELRRAVPKRKLDKLLGRNLSLKRQAIVQSKAFGFLDDDAIAKVARKAVANYKDRVENDPDLKKEILDDPALLRQRVENEVVFQIKEEIKFQYEGEFYIWLPSDADEPDPEHQLLYGQKFEVGVGEMPGDRYGCRCGMEILVKGTQLDL